MSLLIKGIDRLSQLIIDADKDWNAKGITNILETAAMMSKGDLIVRDDAVLARIQAGPPGYVLTSAGPGLAPTWAPAGGALRYYYPAVFRGIIAETVHVGPDLSLPVNARHATSHAQATGDDPADLIKQSSPAFASSLSTTLHAAVDASLTASARYKAAMSILVDGFVEETALAVQTDHTAQAGHATANDLNLSPMSDTVLDKVYIGSNYKFWQAQIQVGTNGAGNWTNVTYYWNGLIWTAAINENDGSNSFQQGTGLKFITHTPQADWALKNIMGYNLYWIMVRTDNFVNRVIKPLGSQIWVAINV